MDCADPKVHYREASWKGMAFYVTTETMDVGRRGDSYEFPMGENVGWRDLGRMARTFQVDGYLAGADHHEQARRMASIAQTPGAGLLVHPIYGEVMVACRRLTLSNDIEGQRRRTALSFDFIEVGMGAAFSGAAGGVLATIGLIDAFIDQTRSFFSENWGRDATGAAAGARLAEIGRIVGSEASRALTASTRASSDTVDAMRYAESQASDPVPDVDVNLFTIHGALEAIYEHGRTPSIAAREIRDFSKRAAMIHDSAVPSGSYAMAATAARLGAAYYVLALADIDGITVDAAMDGIWWAVETLDNEARRASAECDDDSVAAIHSMRAAAIKKVLSLIYAAPGEVSYSYPVETGAGQPSLVVAHNVYGDSRRAEEIERNNRGAFPGSFPSTVRLFTG